MSLQPRMRAAVFDGPGTALGMETILRPEPRAGEVLVRVRACGVCATDLHVIKGEVGFPTPCVLGHEVSGVVEAVGAGVVTCAPGGQVVAAFLMPCGFCRSHQGGETLVRRRGSDRVAQPGLPRGGVLPRPVAPR